MRTLTRNVLEAQDKQQAETLLKAAVSYIDRMTTKGLVHKNTAANRKSTLVKHVNNLG